jgi:hypothetical protein
MGLWLAGLALLGLPATLLFWRISQGETIEANDPALLAGYALAAIAPPTFLAGVRAIKKELLEAGWEFWIVCFVAALGPCLFLGFRMARESSPRLAPISFGFIAAAFGAGFVTWAANSVIQRRAEQERKREKKRKRKQK